MSLSNDSKVPITEPLELVAGDNALWERSFDFYPASGGWALTYTLVLRVGGPNVINFGSTADGDSFLVNVPGTTTAGWLPGDYDGEGYVSNAGTGERYTVWQAKIKIVPNYAGTGPLPDLRTHAQIVYDNLKAVLENRATDDTLSTNIEGTLISRLTPAQLLEMFDRYTVMVQKENQTKLMRSGKRTGRRILTRFKRATPAVAPMGQVGDTR